MNWVVNTEDRANCLEYTQIHGTRQNVRYEKWKCCSNVSPPFTFTSYPELSGRHLLKRGTTFLKNDPEITFNITKNTDLSKVNSYPIHRGKPFAVFDISNTILQVAISLR